MTKLTAPQLTLLQSLADAPQPAPAGGAVAKLIKLKLAALTEDDPPQVAITEMGRDALALLTPKSVTPPNQEPPSPVPTPVPTTKLESLVALLRREEGASLPVMMSHTGWQAHSVRGALAGSLKKARGLNVVSQKHDGLRIYRIVDPAAGMAQ